jgi:hypothetical protein
MPANISVFIDKLISERSFYTFLSTLGGKEQKVGCLRQGALENGDAIIWLHFRGNNFNLDENEQLKLVEYMQNPKTEIGIEISSNDGSYELAKIFCINVSMMFGEVIIYDLEDRFMHLNEIDKALYL